jgi:hypothetical protein
MHGHEIEGNAHAGGATLQTVVPLGVGCRKNSAEQLGQIHDAMHDAFDVNDISINLIENHMVADDQQAHSRRNAFAQHAAFREILKRLGCLPQAAIEPVCDGLTCRTMDPRIELDQIILGSV